MGVVTIRRLDDDVIARLKARAEQHGRSMEEELRRVLTNAAGPPKLKGRELVEYLERRAKERSGGRILPDSVELLRMVRNADPTTSDWDAD